MHSEPQNLRRAKALLSVVHDEYWTFDMFHNIKNAIADGLNVAFLSGNTCCGVISMMSSSDGRPNRVISRIGQYGSIDERAVKTGFPELLDLKHNGPSEATLIGAGSTFPAWAARIGRAATRSTGFSKAPE